MPTPVYGLRLPQKVQDDLVEYAKIYGAPSGRAFAREILEVMTSGDMERVKAFNARLIRGVGEQLTLFMNAQADLGAAQIAGKRAQKPKKRPKRGKVRGRRAKRS